MGAPASGLGAGVGSDTPEHAAVARRRHAANRATGKRRRREESGLPGTPQYPTANEKRGSIGPASPTLLRTCLDGRPCARTGCPVIDRGAPSRLGPSAVGDVPNRCSGVRGESARSSQTTVNAKQRVARTTHHHRASKFAIPCRPGVTATGLDNRGGGLGPAFRRRPVARRGTPQAAGGVRTPVTPIQNLGARFSVASAGSASAMSRPTCGDLAESARPPRRTQGRRTPAGGNRSEGVPQACRRFEQRVHLP